MKYVTNVVNPIRCFSAKDWDKFPATPKDFEPLMFEATWEDAHIYCVGQKSSVVVYTEFISEPSWGVMVWKLPMPNASKSEVLAKFHDTVHMLKNTDELSSDLMLSELKLSNEVVL